MPRQCDPSQAPCLADLPGGGRLEFSVAPGPIRPLQPFTMTVTLRGTAAEAVEVDFAGTQMSMGVVRPRLAGAKDSFSGSGVLPVCVTGSMEWEATVLLTGGARQLAVPFRFTVPAR